MDVVVFGGTGVAGRATLRRLREHGATVRAVARSAAGAATVDALGATPLDGDQDDPDQLRRWLDGADAAIDLRVRIPSPARAAWPPAWHEYVQLRDRAAGRVADAAIDTATPRLVHDTIAMIYADGGDAWLDEDADVAAPGFLAANLACEAHLARYTAAGGAGVALRFAQFYGPHDTASRQVAALVRRGWWPLPAAADAWSSAVHTDDVGTAVALAATADLPAGVYNVADDEPLRHRDLLDVLGTAAGRRVRAPLTPLARLLPAFGRSQRVRSDRFRAATGWQPAVPSRRTGWPAVIADTGRGRPA